MGIEVKEYEYSDIKQEFKIYSIKEYFEKFDDGISKEIVENYLVWQSFRERMNNIYSNMFFYFFNNKKMFKGFAKDILNLNLSNNIKLYKEKYFKNFTYWTVMEISCRYVTI